MAAVHTLDEALTTMAILAAHGAGRGRALTEAMVALVALSRRHLTCLDLAAAVGVPWRTGYRTMHALEATRGREVTYRICAPSLRRLLRL